jgi:hypothetical protein
VNLEDRIQDRIRAESIRPLPRWIAWLVRTGQSLSIFAALFLSAVLCDLFLDVLFLGDVGPHRGFRWILLDLAPWIALAAASILVWLGWRFYRSAGTGYRRRAGTVISVFLVAVLGLGTILHATDAVFRLHRAAARTFPTYRSVFHEKRDRMRMERGMGRDDPMHHRTCPNDPGAP